LKERNGEMSLSWEDRLALAVIYCLRLWWGFL